MSYNVKNYTKQGGEETVIGGKVTIEGILEVKEGAIVEGIVSAAVADNLTTNDGTKALSAKQGKVLKDSLDALIADDLTTDDETKALSAKQGKVLKDSLDALSTAVAGKVAANQNASEEDDYPTVTEFNQLLEKLKLAGLMAADDT